MPFVNIRIVKQAIADDPAGKKARIGAAVTQAILQETGLSKSDVWVVFEEVEASNWFVGDTDVETIRSR